MNIFSSDKNQESSAFVEEADVVVSELDLSSDEDADVLKKRKFKHIFRRRHHDEDNDQAPEDEVGHFDLGGGVSLNNYTPCACFKEYQCYYV